MRAFEVFLNGKRLCVAGIGKDSYISAYITHRSEPNDTWIDVMGLVDRKNLYVQWTKRDLRAGDEVLVKIVDRKSVDKYKIIRRSEWKNDIESMKRAVRAQAKAFGWEIRKKHKAK
jgi:hypothetical protein